MGLSLGSQVGTIPHTDRGNYPNCFHTITTSWIMNLRLHFLVPPGINIIDLRTRGFPICIWNNASFDTGLSLAHLLIHIVLMPYSPFHPPCSGWS